MSKPIILARREFLLAALAVGTVPFAVRARADQPLRVGVNAGLAADAVHIAAKKAKEQGLDVRIVEFTDWITPNSALANGDIDVNYFQHVPFLENAKAARGYDFVPIAPGTMSKLGLYSKKITRFEDLKDGATVAIANDPVNSGRGLILLERAGLIRLKPGIGYKATLADIVENPKRLRLVQLDASQLARSLEDVDLAQGYPSFLKLAGIDPASALLLDDVQPIYAIQWVVRPKDVDDPRVRAFIKIYQETPEVMAVLKRHFGDFIAAAW